MMTERFADPAAMVAALRPEDPVYCVRPHVMRDKAREFVSEFPGDVLYAVKCNSEPAVLDALHEGGVRHFDTASLAEISLVKRRYPDAHAYFMHPVKPRGAIRAVSCQGVWGTGAPSRERRRKWWPCRWIGCHQEVSFTRSRT